MFLKMIPFNPRTLTYRIETPTQIQTKSSQNSRRHATHEPLNVSSRQLRRASFSSQRASCSFNSESIFFWRRSTEGVSLPSLGSARSCEAVPASSSPAKPLLGRPGGRGVGRARLLAAAGEASPLQPKLRGRRAAAWHVLRTTYD